MPLQFRRGTDAEKRDLNQPLAQGEPLWITDTGQLYVGDGNTLPENLEPVVGYGDEEAQDAAAALLTNGIHSDISFNYVDGSNRVDATVSLSQFTQNVDMASFDLTGTGNINIQGNITADSLTANLKGSLFADDSSLLVDAVEGTINTDGTISNNIVPNTSSLYDIGTMMQRFKEIYLNDAIWLGQAQITPVGTAINLPANSTINGEPLGSATFAGTDLNVNIIGDDSSVIVNSSTGEINGSTILGSFVGDIVGSVFADNSSAIIDGTTGNISTPRLAIDDDFVISPNGSALALENPTATASIVTIISDPGKEATIKLENRGTLDNPNDVIGDIRFTEDGEYVSIIQGRRNNIFSTVGYLNTKGITQSSDKVVYGGLTLKIDPSNSDFSDPDSALDIEGVMKLAVQTSAPVTPVEGMIAVADGNAAGFDPKGTDGGVSYPVYYDGSAWQPLY